VIAPEDMTSQPVGDQDVHCVVAYSVVENVMGELTRVVRDNICLSDLPPETTSAAIPRKVIGAAMYLNTTRPLGVYWSWTKY